MSYEIVIYQQHGNQSMPVKVTDMLQDFQEKLATLLEEKYLKPGHLLFILFTDEE